ncbi:MAG: type II secretion system minor pseudopilin GspH [Gammaproteobacteria bacterium]
MARCAARNRVTGARGFTLLELLVVLVIIGVVLSMVTLSTGTRNRDTELSEDASRLAALMGMASDQAVLSFADYGIRFSPHGYRFMILDGQKWRPVTNDELLRPRRLEPDVNLRLVTEGQPVPLTNPGAADEKPNVFLYSSGERTPFTLTFTATGSPDGVQVVGKFSGKVKVMQPKAGTDS